jgi:transposase InsO family protein
LVTYYTVFVMDLASRRVHILGSTPHPGDAFIGQMVRLATAADDGVLAGIRVVLTPACAPNANAYAEQFVRSIKEECLERMIPLGERHLRRAITEFVEHYHLERNHQGLDNRLIMGRRSPSRPEAGEHDPEAPVRLREPQPCRSGALQHLQLVP